MKKTFILSSFILVLALGIFSACSSVMPLASDVSFPADSSKYAILGRVTLEANVGKNSYTKLIEKAKQMYPGADDVVKIHSFRYCNRLQRSRVADKFDNFVVESVYEF